LAKEVTEHVAEQIAESGWLGEQFMLHESQDCLMHEDEGRKDVIDVL
jgi:hypothetical protein